MLFATTGILVALFIFLVEIFTPPLPPPRSPHEARGMPCMRVARGVWHRCAAHVRTAR